MNPYQSYQLLTNLEDQLKESEYERQQQPKSQQITSYYSKFPSLVNSPSISLNGPDSLTKYKPIKSIVSTSENTEFRNLLASIKAIQPVVNERLDLIGNYIKQASHQETAPHHKIYHLPSREAGQAEYYDNIAYNEPKQEESQSRPGNFLPFQAEGMADPYDEIQDLDSGDKRRDRSAVLTATNTNAQPSTSVREPKARRKLTNSPAMLQNDHKVVLSPRAYQQQINSVSKKESILGSMSDVYFVGK